jgi:glycosyltransferase involved in cell wall biosynthesis
VSVEARAVEPARIRRVSVIAPMWNEAAHVDDLVADFANQDFEGQVDLLVADGRSTDDSVARLRDCSDVLGVWIYFM